MATGNIILSKGNYSVTLQSVEVDRNYSNKVSDKIPTTREPQGQSLGPRDKIVIDLLDITHEMLVRGEVTPTASKTAKENVDDLISILKGASVSAGQGQEMYISVTYGTETFKMFMTKLAIKEKANDYDPDDDTDEKANYQDVSKYTVQITLLEGVSAI